MGNIAIRKIEQFTKLCKDTKLPRTESLITKASTIDSFKLDFNKPLLRGQLIEEILIRKLIYLNKNKCIHNIQGRLTSGGLHYYVDSFNISKNTNKRKAGIKLIDELVLRDHIFDTFKEVRFNAEEINFKPLRVFKAKKRCFTKPSIEYCFIDAIIDDTIIDIKTDIHSKDLKKYVKQVFLHSIMYSSFLSSKRTFSERFAEWEIDMINMPIDKIAIYYWRTNEFFQYNIFDIIPEEKYKKLVVIYSSLHSSLSRELRDILRKHLFTKK